MIARATEEDGDPRIQDADRSVSHTAPQPAFTRELGPCVLYGCRQRRCCCQQEGCHPRFVGRSV